METNPSDHTASATRTNAAAVAGMEIVWHIL